MASPLDDPLGHSIDTDFIHLAGGGHFNVHEWTRDRFGGLLSLVGLDGLSKFMLLESIAAILCVIILLPYAMNIRRHGYPKGRMANLVEMILVFIRDNVAVPAIGTHHAHHFLPFLWSMFFFILMNNLLGLIPWLGSATGALGCTLGLALCSFIMIHGSGIRELGLKHYAESIVPPVPVALFPLMLLIEIIGHIIRPTILAVRLFVNMLAGHTVLFVILAFIGMIGPGFLYYIVTPASVMGVVALSFLELFVAFLQAYVFVFLTAIFIGGAVHPHH